MDERNPIARPLVHARPLLFTRVCGTSIALLFTHVCGVWHIARPSFTPSAPCSHMTYCTRNLLYNPFIARHAKITFFDPTSMLPIPPGVPLDPDTFSYLPSLYETEKATLSAKDPTKMTHHDHTLLSHLTTESAENLVLDFSANFLPPLSRPKLPEPVTEFTAVDLLDLNAPLSDISDEDSSSSSSSSSDDGGENFSMLMSSAISGADSKGAARRQRQALRAVRKKEKQKRAVEREARAAVRQQYEERKNNKKQRKLKAELYAKQATQRANEQAAKEDQKRRLRPPRASVLQQALFAAVGEGTDSDSDSDSDSSPSLPLRGEAQPTPASDPPFSPCSSTSSSDSEFGQWKPPLVSVGDTLTVLQYPDAHDAQHPHSRTVKIHVIADSKIYYRIDPTLDTHRISAGAVLIKLYPDELTYKVIGIHTGRTSTLNNKPIDWCHEGYLLTRAFMRMREDVTKQVEHDAEADSTEVKVTSANFRKVSPRRECLGVPADLLELILALSLRACSRRHRPLFTPVCGLFTPRLPPPDVHGGGQARPRHAAQRLPHPHRHLPLPRDHWPGRRRARSRPASKRRGLGRGSGGDAHAVVPKRR